MHPDGLGTDTDSGFEPLDRPAVRVLAVDAAGRVLLLRWRDPVGGRSLWEPPGGGIEEGESEDEAARRELYEETGIEIDDLGTPVARVRRSSMWAGRRLVAIEPFFVVPVTEASVRPMSLTPEEEATFLGHRWWSREDLLSTDEEIEPPELIQALTQGLHDLLDR